MLGIVALSLLLIGVALGSYVPTYYDLENAEQYFTDFIQKYEKNYENPKEYRTRFEIFKKNLQKYNDWNDYYKHEKGGHGITQFSDQTSHKSCLNWSQMPNTTNEIQIKKEILRNLPDHVDYREQNLVTPIKNQGLCESCYDFAAIANIEGMHAKKTGQLVSLSEQQVIDCIQEAGNCGDGGVPLWVMTGLAAEGGSEGEEDYPYEGMQGSTCRFDQDKVKVKVTDGRTYKTPDVDSLKAALVQNGAPLSITLFASHSQSSTHGFVILNPDDCNNEPANHAVLLVGYSTDKQTGKSYWIIKNSWGTNIGDKGYFYFDVNNNCSIGKDMTCTSIVE